MKKREIASKEEVIGKDFYTFSQKVFTSVKLYFIIVICHQIRTIFKFKFYAVLDSILLSFARTISSNSDIPIVSILKSASIKILEYL